ncbi:hypothetical protein P775_07105 [Puniceibacterium antarcticum]|uniref:Uncharacterized protein n=1 Tax=Puniceibacterium antarcticum TaxID=1206336 RepID=A0A2G8RH62_9RHOB|nr:hypothetical protein [Puniceibacterium antarcticum]PIL20925.1 hypothetical protein P775_07105 [Puniceibacterium antarcticum]
MKHTSHAIAIFPDHAAAEDAVKTLGTEGFAMEDLRIITKGYHTDEKVIGFDYVGDRVKFWGSRGAFCSAFCGGL